MTFVPWAVSGPDVSRWQGAIDCSKVADAGFKYVGIRASVGMHYTDQRFEENFDNATVQGIIPIPYQVIRPDHDVKSNLKRLLDSLNGREATGYVLDVELHGNQDSDTVTHRTYWLLRAMQDEFPDSEIIIYTADWFWTPWIGTGRTDNIAAGWPAEYALWVAGYWWPTLQEPLTPIGWRGLRLWEIWQHTNRGRTDGVDGNCDQNFMKPPLFARLGGDSEPPPDDAVPIEISYPAGQAEITITEV